MKWGIYLLMLILLVGIAQAATIYGSVYDFYLDKIDNGKAVITTEPRQQMVLVNSSYSFEVEKGEYDLYGYQLENGQILAATKERVVISSDGDYNVDLILFPYLGEEENILKESENLFEEEKGVSWALIVLFVGLVIIFFALLYLAYVKLKKIKKAISPEVKLDKELQKIVNFIKKEGGRATQKEIRREFPLSEGKISLMISELEEKGVIKRIKKGRGNIVVLKNHFKTA